ncbi:unnamed protein product [Echinostoma caproni]|uniref:Anion-transporting ATPase-like domain-containing protein n=1 Tax=Echinostoma caproni TaxID=27848 RepID=A0A183BFJ1_9TREM|nr:unnamed protein product [Echinostoma caproni]
MSPYPAPDDLIPRYGRVLLIRDTLRLLAFPKVMEKSLSKFTAMKNEVAPLLKSLMGFLGWNNMQVGDSSNVLETRFMYGTERLIRELPAQEVDVHNVIANQLLFPKLITAVSETSSNQSGTKDAPQPPTSCRTCLVRRRIQTKNLEQKMELYEDMHVIQLPHLEVRGVASVQVFMQRPLKPFRR